ncbi:hypothetical protein GF336_04570 [Candidatus Woesearchaeota archaeon]|nr:hypothetical protein [Candidatus Woesearchaeota archaeon]
MGIENRIINYTLSKLFFPKVVVIDKPGVIYTKQDRLFGNPITRRRIVYYFEDILVELHKETVKQIGPKKTAELWYKIGKDVGTRFLLLSKVRKPNHLLIQPILDHIFAGLRSGGQSFAKKVKFNPRKKTLVLEGDNNVFCRKTGDGSFFAGLISGIMSFLVGENIETETRCNCPANCRIIADPKFKKKYIPDFSELAIDKKYFKMNFPVPISIPGNSPSFSDMIRFKKIRFNKRGKPTYSNKAIIPGEPGMVGITYLRMSKSIKNIDKILTKSSEKLANDIFKNKFSTPKKIKETLNLLCVLGYGIPSYRNLKEELEISFKFPPYSKYNYDFQARILNGFLNAVYNRRLRLIKYEKTTNKIIFLYS